MGRMLRIFFLFFLLIASSDIFAQSVVVSSYYNAADPRDEWTELLVIDDNTDIRNWTLQDNNSNQNAFQPWINFANIALWNNLRAGTIIMVWHRSIGSTGTSHPIDQDKSDGYLEVSANDPAFFILTNASFGTSPLFAGATLNVAAAGDLLQLLNSSGTFVHALGHIPTIPPPPPPPPGGSWHTLPLPKLNQKSTLTNSEAVFICPGTNINEFGWNAPQDGTTWTSKSSASLSFGLPNQCAASSTANSDYWRSLRQPTWTNPTLSGIANAGNTQVTLDWSLSDDPNPGDGTQGYMLLRNTTNVFGIPNDGHTYMLGENIGGAVVIALIPSSQTHTYIDNITVPCPYGVYYSVYTFRYTTDNIYGNNYNSARGRAYNETSIASCQVNGPMPAPPVSASSDRDNFCADDPGNITLSATGGSGNTLQWFSGVCGGTSIGTGTSITIPSPTITTTYFARWENDCGNSSCVSVNVTVIPNLPASVAISASQNPVCQGIMVIFTAIPVNGGTPTYTWYKNDILVTGEAASSYSYIPANSDRIKCVMNSSLAPCVSGNPATSNEVTMIVNPSLLVSVSISADQNPVCLGDMITFTANPVNGGTPAYVWYKNDIAIPGQTTSTYAYLPADGDRVKCIMTSSLSSCISGNPATSNEITVSVSSALPASVGISADQNPVCQGELITFTAVPVNGGTPVYAWFKGNILISGQTGSTYSYIPTDGDKIKCIMTSSLTNCITENPATSNEITVSVSTGLPASVSVSADPNPVCQGELITFSAVPVNGGVPVYAWYMDNVLIPGQTGSNYSYIPTDGDKIKCIMTSSLTSCVTGNPATSNEVTVSVVTILPASVSITADQNPVCQGMQVAFTAMPVNGGTPAYSWYKNNLIIPGESGSAYLYIPIDGDMIKCIMTSSLGSCVTGNPAQSNTIAIIVTNALQAGIGITADPETICPGQEIIFTAQAVNPGNNPDFEWFIDGISVQQGDPAVYSTITYKPGQSVICRMTSSLSCVAENPVSSLPVSVVVVPAPVVKLTNEPYLCAGVETRLDAGSGFSSYLWQDGSTEQYYLAKDEGAYFVMVTDSLSCTGSDTVLFRKCSQNLYVPTAFSPNGDNLNDQFILLGNIDEMSSFSMRVFNRWGELIFESNDIQKGWDGFQNGKSCPQDTYTWIVNYQVSSSSPDAKPVTLKGTVTLIR